MQGWRDGSGSGTSCERAALTADGVQQCYPCWVVAQLARLQQEQLERLRVAQHGVRHDAAQEGLGGRARAEMRGRDNGIAGSKCSHSS